MSRYSHRTSRYSHLYLSHKFEKNDLPETREAILKAIAGGSVISWQHINLIGEYDFSGSEERLQDSFGIKLPKLMIEMGEILGGGKIQ